MPLRRLTIFASATIVASLGIALFAVLVLRSYDTSALPGVPASHLSEQQLEVELADSGGFVVPSESAQEIARRYARSAEISETIPLRLRSGSFILFDGFAWAVVFDTSTGDETGPLSGLGPNRWTVLKRWDYFIILVDAECGYFLRVIAPGFDQRDWPTSTAGEIGPGRTVPTEFCEARTPE